MRTTFLLVLLSLGAGGAMLVNARREEALAKPVVANTAAPTATVSQHNWAKNAIDRTTEVKRQVADQHKENDAN